MKKLRYFNLTSLDITTRKNHQAWLCGMVYKL